MMPGISIPAWFTEINQVFHQFPVIIVAAISNIEPTKKEKPKWLKEAEEKEIQKLREERKIGQNIDLYI